MRQIKNVVFDFGGVIIDIDRDRAVKKFVEIGVKDADNLLDKYHQKGIFLEIEDGRIDAESFRLKLSEICGKELTYKEVELGWRGFVTAVEQYKLDYLNILRQRKYNVYILSNTIHILWDGHVAGNLHQQAVHWMTMWTRYMLLMK